jgi:outer membrane protein insertion porin family
MRMSFRALGLPIWMSMALLAIVTGNAHAQAVRPAFGGGKSLSADGPDFIVGDIRIEGLQRISEGTVFNYLPVNIGDLMSAQRVRESIRALNGTGFFRDVEITRDGNTLVVAVLERPSVESVELKGNKDIKTEDLQKSLRQIGLAAGKTFNRSTLEELTQYLTDQYYSRGKYAVTIDTKIEDLSNNRVRVNINIKEGARAKIRQINIVGNTAFKEKDVLEALTLKTPNWMSWYKQGDRYSQESLKGDLEKIQQYYQDRGYANFSTDSVQVAIAPDKADMYITVNVTEGKTYKIGDVKLAGDMIVGEDEIRRLLLVVKGQMYSQKIITATEDLIKNRLGAEGFFFANVTPVPEANEAKREVSLTFYVEPGSRVYVREIKFTGTTRSNDETLRRELRQLEGALLSKVALERSKQRLQQQNFVEEVDYTTEQVSGSTDLVDVDFKIKERPSATIGGGIGYSASQGFLLNGNFSDSNFMGTGNNVSLQLDAGQYNKIYSFSHTNPYQSVDGLSRTVSLSYRSSTQFVSQSSDFKSQNIAVGLSYGYPITEFQRISAGASVQRNDLLTYAGSSAQQAVDWVQANGSPYHREILNTFTSADGSTVSTATSLFGTKYTNIELNTGWVFDSRNRGLFADRGQRHTLGLSYDLPGGARNWLASYDYTGYVPLWGRWTLEFGAQVAYGAPLGKTTGLSPYRRFYGGGPDDVRGFVESSLGPKDSFGNPYGGNLKVAARTELILPMPRKWQSSARVTAFYDMGNVFSTDDTSYLGRDLRTPVDYKFKYSELKRSVGIAVQWLAPSLGIFRFSYAKPLNVFADDPNSVRFPDRTENFQFTVGQSF